MGRTSTVIGAMIGLALGGALVSVGSVGLGAEPTVAEAPKEVGVKGVVARGAAEGEFAIKVSFGKKKVISYQVAPESPKVKEIADKVGKTVEATGAMRKNAKGENEIVVTGIKESGT